MDLLKTVIKPLSITLNKHYSPLGLMKTNGSDKKKKKLVRRENREKVQSDAGHAGKSCLLVEMSGEVGTRRMC